MRARALEVVDERGVVAMESMGNPLPRLWPCRVDSEGGMEMGICPAEMVVPDSITSPAGTQDYQEMKKERAAAAAARRQLALRVVRVKRDGSQSMTTPRREAHGRPLHRLSMQRGPFHRSRRP
jgi:hypothetical protein